MIYRRKRSRLRTNRYVVHVVVSLLQSTLYINVYRKNYSLRAHLSKIYRFEIPFSTVCLVKHSFARPEEGGGGMPPPLNTLLRVLNPIKHCRSCFK